MQPISIPAFRLRPAPPPWHLHAAALGLLLLSSAPLGAGVIVEKTYSIRAGWNLIQVPFDPAVDDPQEALASIDWESLWTWVPGTGGGQDGLWVSAHRDAPAILNSLRALPGPAAYALRARGAGSLTLSGALVAQRDDLLGGTFQLFAPALPPGPAPTLAQYFSRPGARELIGEVFELSGDSARRIRDNDVLRDGAAYFVFPIQDAPSPDPVRLSAGLGGLRFDAQATLQEIEVDIGADPEPRQLMLSARPSADGRSTTDWLELLQADGAFAAVGSGQAIEVPPEATRVRISLRASQQGLVAASAALQGAILEISADNGGVTVGAELESPTLRGTWIGEAILTEVERMSLYGAGFAPAPNLAVSLILEIPATGRPRLHPCIQIESSRDGRETTLRLEAAQFHQTVVLLGAIGANGASGTLTGAIDLSADHPLNPYRHRYHPEHALGYAIERSLTLRFGAEEPELSSPFASVGVLRGAYEEEITGLSQEPIRIRGSFRLRKLASVNAAPCAAAGQ
jgi:hypothetical protein